MVVQISIALKKPLVYVYIILRTPMGVYKEYFVIIIKTLLQIKNYIYDISHKVFKYEVVYVFYT